MFVSKPIEAAARSPRGRWLNAIMGVNLATEWPQSWVLWRRDRPPSAGHYFLELAPIPTTGIKADPAEP
jgi:hypothetical protein